MTAKFSSNSKLHDLLMHPLAAPVAGAVATVGVGALSSAVQRYQDAKADAASYKQMMGLHPSLQQRPEAKVRMLFQSLRNVNPTLARDPLVAGAWVDNVIENNASLGDSASNQALLVAVKDMAQVRSHISGAVGRERDMRRGVLPGVMGQLAGGGVSGYQAQHNGQRALDARKMQLDEQEKQLGEKRRAYTGTILNDKLRALIDKAKGHGVSESAIGDAQADSYAEAHGLSQQLDQATSHW